MKEKWLEQGYAVFAEHGPDQLSIKQMAKRIGASRSSFYHYFGDLDIFTGELLKAHWELSQKFNREGEKQCKKMMPDLYLLLSKYPVGLRFSWQLFHHRHIPRYNYLYLKTYQVSAQRFGLKLFAHHMNLDVSSGDLLNLYEMLGEAWYSRLNPNDFSAAKLQQHAESVIEDLSAFMHSGLYTSLK